MTAFADALAGDAALPAGQIRDRLTARIVERCGDIVSVDQCADLVMEVFHERMIWRENAIAEHDAVMASISDLHKLTKPAS